MSKSLDKLRQLHIDYAERDSGNVELLSELELITDLLEAALETIEEEKEHTHSLI